MDNQELRATLTEIYALFDLLCREDGKCYVDMDAMPEILLRARLLRDRLFQEVNYQSKGGNGDGIAEDDC